MQIKIHTDGGSRGNPGVAGGGMVASYGDRELHAESFAFGKKTNNEAEYLAVIKALEWLQGYSQENPVKSAQFYLDSKLVVEQLSRNWKIREPRLRKLAGECWKEIVALPYSVDFFHVKRHKNVRADLLANQAMDEAEIADS
jgi:ribonuclease HI